MKSELTKGRKTIERWQEGSRWLESRSKWIGINTTGICSKNKPTNVIDDREEKDW